MEECIFCRIARGEIPATTLYADPEVLAIADLNPQAPVHALVLPRAHFADLGALTDAGQTRLAARLLEVAAQLGRQRGTDGFRVVANTGPDGGQTVGHLHFHVLAGRHMGWPPG